MWETISEVLSNKTEYTGQFVIPDSILDAIKEHAAETPDKETGGMLFGSIERNNSGMEIKTNVVVNIKQNKSTNTSTYFGVESDYATKILHKYEPEYLYLGNWHSHLGYGGPSSADRQEVTKFFQENKERNITLDFIMDRQSESNLKYKSIIDVYERKREGTNEFQTYSVTKSNLVISDIVEEELIITNSEEVEITENESNTESGNDNEDIDQCSPEKLIEFMTTKYNIDNDDIRTYDDKYPNETVVLAPLMYTSQNKPNTEIFLKISFPEDNSGDIFVDLASRDLEKQLTIEKIPVTEVGKDMSKLTKSVTVTLEKTIPALLEQPLADVLNEINPPATQNVRWEICQQ